MLKIPRQALYNFIYRKVRPRLTTIFTNSSDYAKCRSYDIPFTSEVRYVRGKEITTILEENRENSRLFYNSGTNKCQEEKSRMSSYKKKLENYSDLNSISI